MLSECSVVSRNAEFGQFMLWHWVLILPSHHPGCQCCSLLIEGEMRQVHYQQVSSFNALLEGMCLLALLCCFPCHISGLVDGNMVVMPFLSCRFLISVASLTTKFVHWLYGIPAREVRLCMNGCIVVEFSLLPFMEGLQALEYIKSMGTDILLEWCFQYHPWNSRTEDRMIPSL